MSGLVGRARELAAIDAALRTPGGVLALSGEPGIGKTRLLAELAARAQPPVLQGRALEFERAVPFAPFADALDGRLDARRLRLLDREQLAELAHVLPGLPGAPRPALEAERYRLHRAVRALLDALAPLVLVLDDMHWADEASLERLTYLLRRPPRIVIALAYRARQAPAALLAGLDASARAGTPVRVLELGPLSAPEIRELLGGTDAAAGLVAEGLTNREIAAELHLSTKTIEMHITRACAKLGVRRRIALARVTSAGGGL